MAIRVEDPQLLRFTAAEATRMFELGLFAHPDRIELLDGLLVEKPMKGEPHERTKARLNLWLARSTAPDRHELRLESPFAAPDGRSLPEPDFMVIPADHEDRPPSRVLLAIEVSASSLRTDLSVKAPIYARANVPEYWVVDVNAREIVVHTEPRADRYAVTRHVAEGALSSGTLDVDPLDVAALFA